MTGPIMLELVNKAINIHQKTEVANQKRTPAIILEITIQIRVIYIYIYI